MRSLLRLVLLICFLATSAAAEDSRAALWEVLRTAGPGTVVVFDLDDTLFSAVPRNLKIFRAFAGERRYRRKFPRACAHLSRVLAARHVVYRHAETLANVGITGNEGARVLEALLPFWKTRFFSNRAVLDDGVTAGAVAYVNEVWLRGGTVVYLTGRDRPRMGSGTERALRAAGFPLGSRARLFLKPDPETADLVFKKKAIEEIRTLGKVIAFFDNEPENLVAMAGARGFPRARGFFLDTARRGSADVLVKLSDIRWIRNFDRGSR